LLGRHPSRSARDYMTNAWQATLASRTGVPSGPLPWPAALDRSGC
jgi:hypothetical protein